MKLTEEAKELNLFEVGMRIQQARLEKEIKSIDMAATIGIHKDVYSRIENGRCICRADKLYVLAQYLEVSVDYLLSGDESCKEVFSINQILNKRTKKDISKILKLLEVLFED